MNPDCPRGRHHTESLLILVLPLPGSADLDNALKDAAIGWLDRQARVGSK